MKGNIIKELRKMGVTKHPDTQKHLSHSRTSDLIRLLESTKKDLILKGLRADVKEVIVTDKDILIIKNV